MSEGAVCAHSKILHHAGDNPNGTKYDAWICPDCLTHFVPQNLISALEAEVKRLEEEIEDQRNQIAVFESRIHSYKYCVDALEQGKASARQSGYEQGVRDAGDVVSVKINDFKLWCEEMTEGVSLEEKNDIKLHVISSLVVAKTRILSLLNKEPKG